MSRHKQTFNALRLVPCIVAVTVIAWSLNDSPTNAQSTQPDTQPSTQPDSPREWPDAAQRLARKIERAHGDEKWKDVEAIECTIKVEYGGHTVIDGRMLYEPHRGRVRIDMNDDDETTLIFDGDTAWISPADSKFNKPRFHLLTWSYFLAAPFKLRDPGVNLSEHNLRMVTDKLCPSMKVTFEPGTGDSPDDWYIVYAHPQNNRLHALAYIVTYDRSVEQAEAEPHVLLYERYRQVDGVWLSTLWEIRHWSETRGAYGETLGRIAVENIRFVPQDKDAFDRPDNAREVPKP